jgi:hypothetical protein
LVPGKMITFIYKRKQLNMLVRGNDGGHDAGGNGGRK